MAENYKEVINENQEEIDVVQLKDNNGRVLNFYHIGTIPYEERWFAFFQPAEEIEDLEMEEVVIFEIVGDDGNESLQPVMDEDLLDKVYEKFIEEMEEDEDEDECGCGCGHHHDHKCGCGDHDCDCDDDCDCDCDDDCDCDGEHKCKCGHYDEDED